MSPPLGFLDWLKFKKKPPPPVVVEEELQKTYRTERQMAKSMGPLSAKQLFRAWHSTIRTMIRHGKYYGRKPPYLS